MIDVAVEIFRENTFLQVLLAGLAAIALISWGYAAVSDNKGSHERRASEELSDANSTAVVRARRSVGSGRNNALARVLAALDRNEAAIGGYEPIPEERLARRVSRLSDLFNPDFRNEWLWNRDADQLRSSADLVESLGEQEIAALIRNLGPYHAMLLHYSDLDIDPPDDMPERDLSADFSSRTEAMNAWEKIHAAASERLEKTYPWDDGTLHERGEEPSPA